MPMQTLKRTTGILALLGLGSLVLFNLEIVAQSRNQEARGPLSSVPTHQRPRLIARLNLLVEYQGTRQWRKMYDLSTGSINRKQSREAFVENQQKLEPDTSVSTLLAFTPTEAITLDESHDGGLWEIFGCARYREKERIVSIKARVTAELEDNEWFFSEIGAATQIDGPEEPCSMQERSIAKTGRTATHSSLRCRKPSPARRSRLRR